MRLVVLDPNLDHTHGHHALYDRLLAREATRRGCEAVIIGNRKLGQDHLDEIPVLPVLETTCYQWYSQDPVFGAYDDVEQGNNAVFNELSALPSDFFRSSDLVVVHTVSQITLTGLISWIATLPVSAAPQFCIFLMLPSGIGLDEQGQIDLVNPAWALAYREAFRRAKALPHDIMFFGSGHQHAREFAALSGIDITSHAILTSFDETPISGEIEEDKVLLFAGDAKMNKGLGQLPDLIETVCPASPDLRFVVHANPGAAWGEAVAVVDRLREIAPAHPNLDLRLSALSSEDYVTLLTSSAISTLCYDPDEYRRKSSGVVWESIASKSQLVVPKDTWLERECLFWKAPHVAYAKSTPASIARALTQVIRSYAKNRGKAAAAAERFAAANGVKAMFDQIADFWVARSDSFLSQSAQSITLSASDFGDDGWYGVEEVDGKKLRWGSDACVLQLPGLGLGTWTLTLSGPFCFDKEQLEKATIDIDGQPCPITYTLNDSNAWTLSVSFEETRIDMPRRSMSIRPKWTNSSAEDPRSLGLLAEAITIKESSAGPRAASGQFLPASDMETPDADGWTAALSHGRWVADMKQSLQDCVIAFCVEGSVSPDDIQAAILLLNGQPAVPRLARDEDWKMQIFLPGTASVDGKMELDIVMPVPARIQEPRLIWTLADQAPQHDQALPKPKAVGGSDEPSAPRQLFVFFPPRKMVRQNTRGENWVDTIIALAEREGLEIIVCSPNSTLPEHATTKLTSFPHKQFLEFSDINMPTVFELASIEDASNLHPGASYKIKFEP